MPWWKDPITLATVVIAFSSIMSFLVSVLLWNVSRKYTNVTQSIFEAAHRPYVGVLSLDGSFSHHGGNPPITANLQVVIKNSGSVPALDITTSWRVVGWGKPIKLVSEEPKALLPGVEEANSTKFSLFEIEGKDFGRTAALDLLVTLDYKGIADKKYRYEQHAKYNPIKGFVLTSAKAT